MVQITFVQPDGSRKKVEATAGTSVMEAARDHAIPGIVAECGGAMMCATCHCHVDEAWADQTGARKEGEDDMLEFSVEDLRDNSRLSCQIEVTEELDGLVVHIPETQV